MSITAPVTDIIVVGAGISGLSLTHYLHTQLQYQSVHIIEKSSGVGGRIATRRNIIPCSIALFDHGAQWYKLRPETEYIHNILHTHQQCRLWFTQKKDSTVESMYSSNSGGMNQLCKYIRNDGKLNIEFNKKLIGMELYNNNTQWKLIYDNKTESICNQLILCVPVPQALELLNNSNIRYNHNLNDIQYAKALCALIEFNVSCHGNHNTIQVGEYGQIENINNNIHSITDQHAKGTSPVPAWTVIMTPAWSDKHYNESDNDVLQLIVEQIQLLYPSIDITAKQLKKWRYSHSTAKPDKNRMIEIVSSTPLLMLVGDGLGGGSIAGAMRSTVAAMNYLKQIHKSAL